MRIDSGPGLGGCPATQVPMRPLTAWQDLKGVNLADPKLVWYSFSFDRKARIPLADFPGSWAEPATGLFANCPVRPSDESIPPPRHRREAIAAMSCRVLR